MLAILANFPQFYYKVNHMDRYMKGIRTAGSLELTGLRVMIVPRHSTARRHVCLKMPCLPVLRRVQNAEDQ